MCLKTRTPPFDRCACSVPLFDPSFLLFLPSRLPSYSFFLFFLLTCLRSLGLSLSLSLFFPRWFSTYQSKEYARSGNKATQAVNLVAGPLPQFSHALEPQLRKLGLPTSLQRGVVTLDKDYCICEKDAVLTPEQARLLVRFTVWCVGVCVSCVCHVCVMCVSCVSCVCHVCVCVVKTGVSA